MQPIVLRWNPGIPGVRLWADGNLSLGFGLLFLLGRNVLPDFISIVVSNALIVGGICLIRGGFRMLLGRPPAGRRAFLLFMAAYVCAVSYFTYGSESIRIRAILLSLFSIVPCLAIVRDTVGSPSSKHLVHRIFAGMAAFHALFNIVRVCALAGAPEGGNLYDDGILLRENIIELILFLFILSLEYVLAISLHLSNRNRELSEIDSLTRVFNRRVFSELLERERRRAVPFALLYVDIDRFKAINDTFGHAAGDCVLEQFALRLRETLRSRDIIGRLGGDEFAVIMPDADASDARSAAERAKRRVETSGFDFEGTPIKVTVSIGIAGTDMRGKSFEQINREADAALYEAKRSGRNRVVTYEPADDARSG